ncbi:DUF1800 domain-containing protein [Variovorax sp. J22R133]|uniref:DUF1800 domain-containing protein n=1 Tax=Variovorax brevis TaxID=3053503 RepID=UPI002577A5C9|nr:DUF1800 domain-containing protein [Variovorax sp. J22R133]MDM0113648.1 DUF1800 domain-containing protein [Variovorax sp. J22R133]
MTRAPWRWMVPAAALLLAACASFNLGPPLKVSAPDKASQLRWLDRVSWGANGEDAERLSKAGLPAWLREQLHPGPARLPPQAQAQIDAMTITQTPFPQLLATVESQLRAAAAPMSDDAQKKAAQQLPQDTMNLLSREAQQRMLLRALYSPNQLQEQMTWFWMNHFHVSVRKANVRATVGDYEETVIRPNALGRFRVMLGATMRHPAMLRYLDNSVNAVNAINENYARELMELHTLGVGSGYSQRDVQELARILTGIGMTPLGPNAAPPKLKPELQADYVQQGLFEFNPNRHDYGAKVFLGQPIRQRGLAEADEALDRLARSPATARFISRKIAVYFVADNPPPALVDRMAATFLRSDGDIAATLTTMFEAPEFAASLGKKFRDPVHYVVASVRLAYDQRVATNVRPMISWLSRLGEPLYANETPDGYPLTQEAWASAAQMNARFDIAQAIGGSGAVLFRTDDKAPLEKPQYPPLAEAPTVRATLSGMSPDTRGALAQARSPTEWNTFLLASPELMRR